MIVVYISHNLGVQPELSVFLVQVKSQASQLLCETDPAKLEHVLMVSQSELFE